MQLIFFARNPGGWNDARQAQPPRYAAACLARGGRRRWKISQL